MKKVEAVVCYSWGDDSGEWDTQVFEVPEEVDTHEAFVKYAYENLIPGHTHETEIVYVGIWNWEPEGIGRR